MPRLTFALLLLTAAGYALQLAIPDALAQLRRDATPIASGEWWRLVTALFVQDGGLAGALFNLTCLALLGALAERQWRPGQWLPLYFGGGIACEILALWWQPIGGGNSIANLALGGSLCALGLRANLSAKIAGAAGLLGGAALLVLHDIHGAALLLGAIGATGLRRVRPAAGKIPAQEEEAAPSRR